MTCGLPIQGVAQGRALNGKRNSDGHTARSMLAVPVAWCGLMALSGFLWTKIAFSTEGSGWLYLPGIAGCTTVVAGLQLLGGARFVLHRSAPWFLLFVAWLLMRLVADSRTASDVLGYTIGYGEGVLLCYGMGLSTRLLLDALAQLGTVRVRWLACLVLLAFNTWSALRVEAIGTEDGRLHRSLALMDNETYQVSGALSSVLAIVLAVTCARSVNEPRGYVGVLMKWTLFGVAIGTMLVLARASQLLGSNAGPAFVVPVVLLMFAVGWISLQVGGSKHSVGLRESPVSLTRVLARTLMALLTAAIVGTVAFIAAVAVEMIDVTQYRVFGFEEASLFNASAQSRLRILTSNFLPQLMHSPILGNFFVDRDTTGDGSYTHSLIAILPHLGVVGAILFFVMMTGVARQLRLMWSRSEENDAERRFATLAIVAMAWVVVFMTLTSFFTNVMLWFSLGLLAPAIQLQARAGRNRTPHSVSELRL